MEEALARSRAKRIGVIATEGTVTSRSFELELKKLDPEVEVVQQACPLLVPLIESGEQDWEGTTMILRRYLNPFQGGRVDTLILGCTHYSILKEQIRSIIGAGQELICSGQVTAAKLVEYLSATRGLRAASPGGAPAAILAPTSPLASSNWPASSWARRSIRKWWNCKKSFEFRV